MANEDVQKLVAVVEARSAAAEKQMERFVRAADKRMAEFERRASRAAATVEAKMAASFDKISAQAKRLGGTLLGVVGVSGGVGISRQILRIADDWTSASNKIAAAGTPLDQIDGQMQVLTNLANRSRSGINETVDLYARLSRAKEQLGASDADILRATETVNKALKTGGASAAEAASAVLQLGQALGSGVLQGDELRAIRENSQVLAQAIADEFGVTIGDLKKLGEEGKLTSDRVFKAILKAAAGIDSAFQKTKSTLTDAGTVFWNEMTRFVAAANDAVGISDALSGIFGAVSRNVDLLAGAVTALSTIFIARLAGQGIRAAVDALTAFSARATAAAVQMRINGEAATIAGGKIKYMGGALLSAFGGPVGALITGVGIAVGMYVDSLDDASQKSAEYEAATSQITGGLELLARMQGEAGSAAKGHAGKLKEGEQPQKDAKKLSEALAKARKEEALQTLRAAAAAATLRIENAKEKRAEAIRSLNYKQQLIDAPHIGFDPEGYRRGIRAEMQAISDGLEGFDAEATDAQSSLDLLQRGIDALLNGDLTAPSGEGAAGGIREITDEAEKALKKLKEVEAARKAWRNDPEAKADTRQSLEDISGRQSDIVGKTLEPMIVSADQAAALRDEFRNAFRYAFSQLSAGDFGGAAATFAGAFADKLQDRISDQLFDFVWDSLGLGDVAGKLFGPLDAAQAAQAVSTVQATTAINLMATAAYNAATALATVGGGGGGGGLFGSIGSFVAGLFGGTGPINGAGAGIGGGIGKRALGGPVIASQPYIVGEKRPELFVPNTSGHIIPRIPQAVSRGASLTFAPVINAPGADPAAITRIEAMMQRSQADFKVWAANEKGRVRGHISDLRSRRAI